MSNPLAHNITINMMVYTRVAFVTIKAIRSDWHPIIFIGYSTLIKTGSHQNMYLKISLPIYQILFS